MRKIYHFMLSVISIVMCVCFLIISCDTSEKEDEYTLTVTSTAGGTTTPSGSVLVGHGEPTSITANPLVGYHFVNWTVTSGTANIANANSTPTTVTLSSGDATVRANFAVTVGEKTFEETTPSLFIVGSNESSIVVSGAATDIAKVTVKLTILHQSTDDLELTIQSPLGTQVLLSNRNRGDSGDNYTDTVFDDSATTSISDPSNVSPFTGTFKPEQFLSTFNGEDANGTWKLLIVDDGINGSAFRELSNWSLTISD